MTELIIKIKNLLLFGIWGIRVFCTIERDGFIKIISCFIKKRNKNCESKNVKILFCIDEIEMIKNK